MKKNANRLGIPEIQPLLPDTRFAEVERLINCTIHELVFVLNHAEYDQIEDAAQALMTAQNNLDVVAETLAQHDPSNR
jgi:hypothetical protein